MPRFIILDMSMVLMMSSMANSPITFNTVIILSELYVYKFSFVQDYCFLRAQTSHGKAQELKNVKGVQQYCSA